jgi:DNA/RNA-binding domain of Phe-tRNA-synthetase-like protein
VSNTGSSAELEALKRNAANALRTRFAAEDLLAHRNITAWRETYRSFGVNPKRHPPTVEALVKRITKGSELPSISKVVDSYLVAELEFFLPVGGYDLDKIVSDTITLRKSPGGERFMPLGSTEFSEVTEQGETIYADSERILTRRWNYKDCEMAKIVSESRNVALFTEAAHGGISDSDLRGVVVRIAELVSAHCGGIIGTAFVDVADSLERDLP